MIAYVVATPKSLSESDVDAAVERASLSIEILTIHDVVPISLIHLKDGIDDLGENCMKMAIDLINVSDVVYVCEDHRKSEFALKQIALAKEIGIGIHYEDSDGLLEKPEIESRFPQQFQTLRFLCGHAYRTILKKNEDYGPGNIAMTGEVGVVVRLTDKISRLLNHFGFSFLTSEPSFERTKKEPNFESIKDTWLDTICYGLIGLLINLGVWGK